MSCRCESHHHMHAKVHETTFQAATPYAVAALGIGTAGAVMAIASTSTAAIIAGSFFALAGVFVFYGVVLCGIEHSGDPKGFRENVGRYVTVTAAAGLTEWIATIARIALIELIFGKRS